MMRAGLVVFGLLIGGRLFAGEAPLSASAEYRYSCFSYYWNGDENERGTMLLTVSKTKATADIVEEEWDNLGGDIDLKYRSRGRVKYAKFGKFSKSVIVEEILLTGGRALRDGKLGGFARVEGEAEGGFYQYKFVCKRA